MSVKEAVAYELKPKHKYLLVFDKRSINLADVNDLQNELAQMDVTSIAVGLGTGVDSMRLVDVTEATS